MGMGDESILWREVLTEISKRCVYRGSSRSACINTLALIDKIKVSGDVAIAKLVNGF